MPYSHLRRGVFTHAHKRTRVFYCVPALLSVRACRHALRSHDGVPLTVRPCRRLPSGSTLGNGPSVIHSWVTRLQPHRVLAAQGPAAVHSARLLADAGVRARAGAVASRLQPMRPWLRLPLAHHCVPWVSFPRILSQQAGAHFSFS